MLILCVALQYGFSLGLVGYCLLKVVSVIEFFRNRPEDFKPCGDGSLATAQWDNITFLTVEFVSMAFILGAAIFLAHGMMSKSDDELDELLALPTPTDTNFDFEGMGLVLVTMLGPPILCVFGPRRRHATLKFQYVKVDEEQQIADLTVNHRHRPQHTIVTNVIMCRLRLKPCVCVWIGCRKSWMRVTRTWMA